MRDESNRPGSPYADETREVQLQGQLGWKQVTMRVLKKHLEEAMKKGWENSVLDDKFCTVGLGELCSVSTRVQQRMSSGS